MRQLMKFLCFLRLFCNVFAASSSSTTGTNDSEMTITDVLMGSIRLLNRINNVQIEDKTTPVVSGLRLRPQTPGQLSAVRLSPLKEEEKKKKKSKRSRFNQNLVVIENPLLKQPEPQGRLNPIEPKAMTLTMRTRTTEQRIRQSSWGSKENDNSPIPVQDFYEEVEAAVKQSNSDACSYLTTRPEMKLLKADELFDLVKTSYDRSKFIKNSKFTKNSKRLFFELFEDVVDGIIPKNHPNSFEKFMFLAAKQSVPSKLFSLASKHVKLLSKQSLNDLIREIEIKYVWGEKLEKIGASDLKKFNFMIMEIADNLENCEDLVKLDYVKDVLAMKEDELAMGRQFMIILAKVQFIYLTTYLLGALKSIYPEIESKEMKDALINLISIGRTDLKLDIDDILELMEPVWKVVLPHIEEDQREAFGRLMGALHEIILEQKDLPFIPPTMTGAEDLYFYVTNNLINLTQARLKYYRSNRITKRQLITLLIAAEYSCRIDDCDLILAILASIQIDPRNVNQQDFDDLAIKAKLALKIFFTIPSKPFEGEICTPQESLKQIESFTWKLPADLFLSEEQGKIFFHITDMLLNLPRLFLYRVFGLPLMNFAEVVHGMNEIPEMQELIDVANFFLERWCSNSAEGPYTRIKIQSH